MKTKAVIIGAAVVAIISFGASAQQGDQQPPGGPGAQQGGAQHQESFEDRKQQLVRRMQDRIADMQQRLSCVQQAQDPDALRECFPRRGERGHGGGSEGGHRPPGN